MTADKSVEVRLCDMKNVIYKLILLAETLYCTFTLDKWRANQI